MCSTTNEGGPFSLQTRPFPPYGGNLQHYTRNCQSYISRSNAYYITNHVTSTQKLVISRHHSCKDILMRRHLGKAHIGVVQLGVKFALLTIPFFYGCYNSFIGLLGLCPEIDPRFLIQCVVRQMTGVLFHCRLNLSHHMAGIYSITPVTVNHTSLMLMMSQMTSLPPKSL